MQRVSLCTKIDRQLIAINHRISCVLLRKVMVLLRNKNVVTRAYWDKALPHITGVCSTPGTRFNRTARRFMLKYGCLASLLLCFSALFLSSSMIASGIVIGTAHICLSATVLHDAAFCLFISRLKAPVVHSSNDTLRDEITDSLGSVVNSFVVRYTSKDARVANTEH